MRNKTPYPNCLVACLDRLKSKRKAVRVLPAEATTITLTSESAVQPGVESLPTCMATEKLHIPTDGYTQAATTADTALRAAALYLSVITNKKLTVITNEKIMKD